MSNIIKGILNTQSYMEQNRKLLMTHRKISTNDKNNAGNFAEGFVEDMIGNTFDIHGYEREERLDEIFLVRTDIGREPDLVLAKNDDVIEVKMITCHRNKNGTLGKWDGSIQFNSADPKRFIDKNSNITHDCRDALVLSGMPVRNMIYYQIGVIDKLILRIWITEGQLFAHYKEFYEEFIKLQRLTPREHPEMTKFLNKNNILLSQTTKELASYKLPDGSGKRNRPMSTQPSFNKRFEDIHYTNNKVHFELACLLSNETFYKYNTDIPTKDVVVTNKLTAETFDSKLIVLTV